MEKTKMKRVNLIIDSDLYDKARAMAFLRRASISEIIRKALREWMEKNLDKKAEILLSEKEEKMKGQKIEDIFRLRVGSYRIIFLMEKELKSGTSSLKTINRKSLTIVSLMISL